MQQLHSIFLIRVTIIERKAHLNEHCRITQTSKRSYTIDGDPVISTLIETSDS